MNYTKKYKGNPGWFNESYRHSLARRGIKTGRRLNYVKKTSENDIQRLLTQAQQDALDTRKERIGFSKKEYLKSEFYKGREVTFMKLGDMYYASIGGEFGYVGTGKTKNEAFTIIKNMIKEHGMPSGTVTLNFTLKEEPRYTFKKMDGLYYPYDRKEDNIPVGYGMGFKQKEKINEIVNRLNRINYQQISYQPTQITYPSIPPPDLEEIPEEHKRLEKGWIQRGLRKEAEVVRGVARGTGKVVGGFLGTVATGLRWSPEEQANYSKKVSVITKKEKSFNKKLNKITKDLIKLTKSR